MKSITFFGKYYAFAEMGLHVERKATISIPGHCDWNQVQLSALRRCNEEVSARIKVFAADVLWLSNELADTKSKLRTREKEMRQRDVEVMLYKRVLCQESAAEIRTYRERYKIITMQLQAVIAENTEDQKVPVTTIRCGNVHAYHT